MIRIFSKNSNVNILYLLFIYALIVLAAYLSCNQKMNAYKVQAEKLEQQIYGLKLKTSKIEEYFSLKNSLIEKESLLMKVVGQQFWVKGVLEAVTKAASSDITIHNLKGYPEGKLKKLEIQGSAVSEYSNLDLVVSKFTLDLHETGLFSTVNLVSTERDVYSPKPRAIFKMLCDIKE